MCLLLTCCIKAGIDKEETLESIWKLQTIPQSQQIRSWAILCQDHGINPHRIIYPFIQSPHKGISCDRCKHIEMDRLPHESGRRVYKFVCTKNHQILEAYYVAERILIAPESCTDYQPTA